MTIDLGFVAPVLAAFITAALSSFVTYQAMKRAKSGQINTTEADQLWRESTSIRRELREQVQNLEDHIKSNEIEIAALRSENAALKYEVLTLRQENADLKVRVDALKVENIELRDKTAAVEQRQDREGVSP